MNVGFGAMPADGGVRFRVWAPEAASVELRLRRGRRPAAGYRLPAGGSQREAGSGKPAAGVREIVVSDAKPGDRYAYSIDGGEPRPDPASRYQPDGVHEWSEVVDPSSFAWTDAGWRGLDPRRAVVYELHVGTFTPEGTFRGAIACLPYLRELGVTAIELMPVADFAGRRNWGYDGVALFAPSRAYGRPDDLRAFVDAAHAHDLAVIIDVVYNHLGPEGAYLPSFSTAFLTPKHETPWGQAVNLDDRGSETVRRFLIDNACHWVREYHADGLRLDATHALIDTSDRPFVAELTAAVHAVEYAGLAERHRPLVYAEDFRNMAVIVTDRDRGGWDLDGFWADDFHHVIRRMVAGDDRGYYADYRGDASELADTLRQGWLYTGQHSRHHGIARGTSADAVEMRKAVVCLQNHDQIGNRARGDRLNHRADPAAWRAAVAILLTAPMTPLLFMGQEWSASTPFQFFTDFEAGLGRMVSEGRRAEFALSDEDTPDPQAESTFLASRLRLEERHVPSHQAVLTLHRALLALRNTHEALQASDASACPARALDDSTIMFLRDGARGAAFLIVGRLRGGGRVRVDELAHRTWRRVLDTEDAAFAPDGQPPRIEDANILFHRPGAILFEAA